MYWAQIVLQAAGLLGFMLLAILGRGGLWTVFALIVLLDLVTFFAAVTSWRISRLSAVLLLTILAWLLFGTVLSGADTILQLGIG